MATRKTDLSLPLPLQYLAAWLGRVLQGEPSSPREARAQKSHVDRPGAKAAGHGGKGVGQKGVGITLRISALLTRRKGAWIEWGSIIGTGSISPENISCYRTLWPEIIHPRPLWMFV